MEIVLTNHAVVQMQKRRITFQDVQLVLQLGNHVPGGVEETMEACIEIGGRPITVVYDELDHRFRDLYRIITVIRKKCPQ